MVCLLIILLLTYQLQNTKAFIAVTVKLDKYKIGQV
jgi:hypothetical protein